MDFTIIIGVLAAFGLVVNGIMESGSLLDFYNLPSIIITIGGTFAVLVAAFPVRILKDIPKHLKIAMNGAKKHDPMRSIDTICDFALVARKNGLLALEELANQEKDTFLKDSVLLVVDAVDADKIRSMLEAKLDSIQTRHDEAISFYDRGAALGPAFGMIGTLIGLINMLKSLDVSSAEASSALGEGMSVALVTTFYGSMIANIIFTPIANKLRIKNEEEMLCKSIIMEGVLSIQSGENPKHIREKLTSLLPARTVAKSEKKAGKASGKEKETGKAA